MIFFSGKIEVYLGLMAILSAASNKSKATRVAGGVIRA